MNVTNGLFSERTYLIGLALIFGFVAVAAYHDLVLVPGVRREMIEDSLKHYDRWRLGIEKSPRVAEEMKALQEVICK